MFKKVDETFFEFLNILPFLVLNNEVTCQLIALHSIKLVKKNLECNKNKVNCLVNALNNLNLVKEGLESLKYFL